MFISLISIMDTENKSMDVQVPVELHSILRGGKEFPLKEGAVVAFHILHMKGRNYHVKAEGTVTVVILCDRCLEPVDVTIPIMIDEELVSRDVADSVSDDEMPYLEGYYLDVDQMILSEIAIGWPVKTLCKESCLGICRICGANRNLEPCGCEDFTPDPRMAAIQDIFLKAKEV